MTRPSLHVCIATGQNLANLIPAIQLQASEVVILETPEMRASAENLKAALKSRGIPARRIPFDDATPEAIVNSAQQVALELGEQPLVFNASGGHKLMTLALTDELRDLAGDNLHLLYCETRHDRLDWLKPTPAMDDMADVLKLEDVLFAQGYRIQTRGDRDVQWMADADSRASLTRTLGDGADKLARFFGTLNSLADKALNEPEGPFRPRQELLFAPGGRNADLLRDAQKLGLLAWDNDTEIVFTHADAARYFRGGWLEEYVWLKLRGLKPAEAAINLKIETVGAKTDNELDAAIVHRNRLLIVECKTKRFGRDAGKDSDHIYKLAQLARQVGGLMGRGLLLSARPVDENLRKRARDNQVDLLAAEEVKNLVDYLKVWMGK
ncbi:MAG: DUF1887 family CARF protein [Pseudomonadota bacterium]|nr:DUF1887 family CARF protein [Pseudomonadota bacterium]